VGLALGKRRITRVAGDGLGMFPRRGRKSSLSGKLVLHATRRYMLVHRSLPGEVVDILRVWCAAQDRPDSL